VLEVLPDPKVYRAMLGVKAFLVLVACPVELETRVNAVIQVPQDLELKVIRV